MIGKAASSNQLQWGNPKHNRVSGELESAVGRETELLVSLHSAHQ